jgi:hypothetical protein
MVSPGVLGRRLRKAATEKTLFVLILILYQVPLWANTYIPTEDGPSHLGNAYIIKEYDNPEATRIRVYHVIDRCLSTNVLYHYTLANLLRILPPLAAEKILLSSYLVLFAFAVRYLIVSLYGRPHPAAFLAFPFFLSYPFQMGFFGWMLSLAFATFGLIYYWRHRDRVTPLTVAVLNSLGLATFAAHLLGWGIFVGGVVYLAWAEGLSNIVRSMRRRSLKADWPRFIRDRVLTPLYLAPALISGVWYYFQQEKIDPVTRKTFGHLIRELLTFECVNSFNLYHRGAAVATAAVFGLLIVAAVLEKTLPRPGGSADDGTRKWSATDSLVGGAFVAAVVVYFVCPDATPFRGDWISMRLLILPPLAAVVWLAGTKGRWLRRTLFVVGPTVALTHLALVDAAYREANVLLKRFVTGYGVVAPNSILLPIINVGPPSPGCRVRYIKHAGPYYTLGKLAVDFGNYEPRYAYFPVKWRPGKDPIRRVRVFENVPYYYFRKGHGYWRVDYLIFWDANPYAEKMPFYIKNYVAVHDNPPLLILRRVKETGR